MELYYRKEGGGALEVGRVGGVNGSEKEIKDSSPRAGRRSVARLTSTPSRSSAVVHIQEQRTDPWVADL